MTLYNFGKREGLVQSARDTLDATQYSYTTTANNIVLAAKQAYYGVLQANALLAVNEETVKDREVTLRQTQAFYDVGTKPKSDVTQAEANLYLAQANLIAARNNVDARGSQASCFLSSAGAAAIRCSAQGAGRAHRSGTAQSSAGSAVEFRLWPTKQ
jgi:outer membrane protein TolC